MNKHEVTSTMLMMGCTINRKHADKASYYWNDIPIGTITHINPHNEIEYLMIDLVSMPKGVRDHFIPAETPQAAIPLSHLNNRTLATVLKNAIRNSEKDRSVLSSTGTN